MDRLSSSRRSPLPATPKSGGGAYQSLLASFGARSSDISVTKQRRESALPKPFQDKEKEQEVASGNTNNGTRARLPARDTSDLTATVVSQPPSASPFPTPQKKAPSPERRLLRTGTETTETLSASACSVPSPGPSPQTTAQSSPQKPSQADLDTSADELSQTPAKPSNKPPPKKVPRHRSTKRDIPLASAEGLKMEKYRKERTDRPRRSYRTRQSDILQPDMMVDELAATPKRQKAPPRPKKDTMRQRLRDDIEFHTKSKANNFLVAHKDYFLPLLPHNNYISRLETTAPAVEYQELKQQPGGVMATMKPYQLSGLSFLVYLYNNGISGILGDEMGLGKTLQTLSLFQYLEELDQRNGVQSEEARPYLVVCPLSVLESWINEAHKWVSGLRVLRFHGTSKERDHLKRVAMGIEDVYGNETTQARDRRASRKAGIEISKLSTVQSDQSFKIVVTTYEIFNAEQNWFKHSFVWRYVVLDEGHKIKNNASLVSKALKGVSAEYRLVLTGTPLQNNLVEMWALLHWLYPDVFTESTGTLFKDSFDLTRGKVNMQTMDSARRLLELIMLRRMKDSPSVELGLPPKEEVLLYVPLTPMQRFWYTRLLTRVADAVLDDVFANAQDKEKEVLQKDKAEEHMLKHDKAAWDETADIMMKAIEKEKAETGTRASWQRLMNLVMQLRKCCSHPYLIPGAEPDPYYLGEHVIRASGKFILLEKLLKNSIFKEGKKTIIFSGFTQTLNCCEDLLLLLSDYGQSFKYLRFDGSTLRARRNLDIRLFNQDPNYKVILVSTRAGGLGITLTAAENVIFLDEDWNPQITLQAEARAHRIGQQKKVTIYKLCTQGTVEEQMMGRIRKKLYLSAKITESMRNIHSEGAKSGAGRPSETDDMPQMDTTQLKSLVRRGAQTLSHPDINVNEMLSWDLDTMLQKCRDKPSDPLANPETSTSDVDEEKWLSVMERVECAVFDGKHYQRQREKDEVSAKSILPSSISREDRRKNKNVTVMIDGYAISKESTTCADWEAVPTLAGKDERLKDVKRERRVILKHEDHCLACFDYGKLVYCAGCPRAYHRDCLEEEFQAKLTGIGNMYCAQHECVDCAKKTGDAGGMIFRCRWCENGFCEDCLEWDKTELVGENLPEFEMLGEPASAGAFYIKCPSCREKMDEDEEHRQWVLTMEQSYAEQHEAWLRNRDKEVKELEEEREREIAEQRKLGSESGVEETNILREAHAKLNGSVAVRPFLVAEDDDATSPPALTDTSLPTATASGVSTPNLLPGASSNGTAEPIKRGVVGHEEILFGAREVKRLRLH